MAPGVDTGGTVVRPAAENDGAEGARASVLARRRRPGTIAVPGRGLVGAPEGTRTPNLLIRSQMLYPLSYGRMALDGPQTTIQARGPHAQTGTP